VTEHDSNDNTIHRQGWACHTTSKGAYKMKWVGEGPPHNNIVAWSTYRNFWAREFPHLKVSKRRADICNLCFVFANRHKYSYVPCTHDTDSLSSVSSNTFSVGEVSSMEEDTPDGLGDCSNGEGIVDVIEGIDVIDTQVGDSVNRTLSVVMLEMINKAVRH